MDRGSATLDRALRHPVVGPAVAFVGALVGFAALAWCGDQLVTASSGLATFWPPNGLIIALLVLIAPRLRPWVVAAVLPGELIIDAIQSNPIGASLGWGTVNVLEVCLAAWMILRLIGRDRQLGDTARDYLAVGVAAVAAPLVCGFAGAAVSVASFGGSYWTAFLGWWLGDVTGITLLVALIVSIVRPSGLQTARQRLGGVGAVGLVAAVAVALFAVTREPLAFLMLPPLVLVAVRYGLRSTAMASLALAIVATIFTGRGLGPISSVPTGLGRVLAMQAFIATISSVGFLVCVTMSERRRAEAAFEHLAKHDPLTGLANRRYFMERLDQTTARLDRSLEGAAIAYFDLDGFKEINDRFGHNIGDAALIEVGRRLSHAVRGSDLVARIGGDEFAALLEPVDGIDGAQAAARRIADAVEQPVTFGEVTMPIGLSVGTALVGSSSELALTDADIELYLDKTNSHQRTSPPRNGSPVNHTGAQPTPA